MSTTDPEPRPEGPIPKSWRFQLWRISRYVVPILTAVGLIVAFPDKAVQLKKVLQDHFQPDTPQVMVRDLRQVNVTHLPALFGPGELRFDIRVVIEKKGEAERAGSGNLHRTLSGVSA
jgi:hypothetical protein